jgi:hypothetical protein
LAEELRPFGKAKGDIEIGEIEYPPFSYSIDDKMLAAVSEDYKLAAKMVRDWSTHLSSIHYFIQFCDDLDGIKTVSFHSHTQLVSALCDARLRIDTTTLWDVFYDYVNTKSIHSDYREDADGERKYDEYAARLQKESLRGSDRFRRAIQLIQRIVVQIELKAGAWSNLPPLQVPVATVAGSTGRERIRLFYSYSHEDEALRDALATHLSLLKRQGLIEGWHDREIGAGREWEGQIDQNLKSAHVILLLVSADFIASDYCYDVEMKCAVERHNSGAARVIPIVLRACDWAGSPFGKLQALPTDAKPITSWVNRDEALADVAKGIRKVVAELLECMSGS